MNPAGRARHLPNWSYDQFGILTEDMKHRVINATEFKAKCLALLDEVAGEGNTITITKRGRPMATLTRAKKQPWKSPEGILAGKIKIVGDIVNEDTSDLWECVRDSDE